MFGSIKDSQYFHAKSLQSDLLESIINDDWQINACSCWIQRGRTPYELLNSLLQPHLLTFKNITFIFSIFKKGIKWLSSKSIRFECIASNDCSVKFRRFDQKWNKRGIHQVAKFRNFGSFSSWLLCDCCFRKYCEVDSFYKLYQQLSD